jgi:adenylylsulfate kinase-like enzyme
MTETEKKSEIIQVKWGETNMPEEINDIEKLVEELKKRIQAKALKIITIDGLPGSGKTTLACCLKMKLSVRI